MKKFAVFDIDGTFYRWQLYHELVLTLATAEYFPKKDAIELDQRWNAWRGGDLQYREYEKFVVETMVKNLPFIPMTAYLAACDKVVEQSAHKTHFYPRALLKQLKSRGYTIIAITGTQQELIERFGEKYDFDIVVGAQYEIANNHFTGKTSLLTVDKKPQILKELVEEHDLTWQDSLAIGDTRGDANLLEIVEQPIAFNPDPELFERAKLEGWKIVLERKNMAYQLEKRGDALVLADTIVY